MSRCSTLGVGMALIAIIYLITEESSRKDNCPIYAIDQYGVSGSRAILILRLSSLYGQLILLESARVS